MGVPVLTVAGCSMVSRQAAAVLSGAGEEGWICADASEMAERALELSRDRGKMRERRLEQRNKVAASPLLDHSGLAKSLATSFRQWWRLWLEQQGWTLNGVGTAWTRQYEPTKAPVAVANSPSLQVPLWLGPLSASGGRVATTRKGGGPPE